MISSSRLSGLMLRRQAPSASSAKLMPAIIRPRLRMNSTPRADASSGSSNSARHNGQLATLASHRLTSTARVSGLRGANMRRMVRVAA